MKDGGQAIPHCPICCYIYVCPCKACNDRGAEDITLPRWISLDGEFQDCEACPVCGLTLHLDFWEDISMERYREYHALIAHKDKEN